MQNPQSTRPIDSLRALKERLNKSQELVVDGEGRIHAPEAPELQKKQPNQKTYIKPTRWFN